MLRPPSAGQESPEKSEPPPHDTSAETANQEMLAPGDGDGKDIPKKNEDLLLQEVRDGPTFQEHFLNQSTTLHLLLVKTTFHQYLLDNQVRT